MADNDTETIRINASAWKTLNARKDPGDTFADVVDIIIDEHDQLKYETETHRLAAPQPDSQPAEPPFGEDTNDD